MLALVWPDDFNGQELRNAEGERPEFIDVELTWDTGGGAIDVPGHEIKESKGSRAGAYLITASNDQIHNEGQCSLDMGLQDSLAEINSAFEVAGVSRPRWSMGEVCDGDLEVLFTKTHGVIRDPTRIGRVLACAQRSPGGLYRSAMLI